jgi:hypothetical protein
MHPALPRLELLNGREAAALEHDGGDGVHVRVRGPHVGRARVRLHAGAYTRPLFSSI